MSALRTATRVLVAGALGCCPLLGQQPLGPEFVVYGGVGASQNHSKCASAASGDFVVVWTNEVSGMKDAAWARWFDAGGEPVTEPRILSGDPQGDRYAFSPGTAWAVAAPEVTVAWEWTTLIGSSDRIELRRYSRTGEPLGEPASVLHRELSLPRIATDARGDLSIAWRQRAEGEDYDVGAVLVDPGGEPISEEVILSEGSPDFDNLGGVATAPDGRTVVVWNHEDPAGVRPTETWARRVGADGVPTSPPFRVWDSPNPQRFATVAMDAEAGFVVAWAEFFFDEPIEMNDDVFFRRFDAEGRALGEPQLANVYRQVTQTLPQIAMDLAGNFAIAWPATDFRSVSGRELWGRAFRTDGSPIGDEFRINQLTQGDQDSPSLSLSESGVLLAAFTTHDTADGHANLHARRYVLPCAEDGASLCLDAGRFLVRAQWRTADGGFGFARPRPLDDGSGAFWFFGDANLELIVKVLDGCGINDRHWVYVAGLTDVETHLTVTDTWTGEIWSTETPLFTPFAPVQDVGALAGCAAIPPEAGAVASFAGVRAAPGLPAPEVDGGCIPDEHHLCLQQGRFRVSATYRSALGHSGMALAEPLESDTGAFRFFGPDNLELLVKVLDACAQFDRYWVFAAGLTDLEVELTVEDTASEAMRIYRNPLGVPFVPIQDASAFATCPAGEG